jgi:hypothetical protein
MLRFENGYDENMLEEISLIWKIIGIAPLAIFFYFVYKVGSLSS